jgi:ribonuclease HII
MPKKEQVLLERFYNEYNLYEFGLDEAARGCLFGRVYIACVVLPKDPALFDGKDIKDSKKYSSKTKRNQVAEYIKQHALAWHISYIDEITIDSINILQAVMQGMHDCIDNVFTKLGGIRNIKNCMAIVDGNYFTHYIRYDLDESKLIELPYTTIEKGDNKYMAIAAASILAKTAHDAYITELCLQYPLLSERYGLDTNMGYGTKRHLDGIRENGITQWHRKTFGDLCKNSEQNIL